MESQLRRTQPSLFVSDNIKVAPNLSLDLGIRWEPFLPPVDNLNDQICMDPTFTKRSQFYPNAPPGILFPGSVVGSGNGDGDADCPRQLVPHRWKNFAPRFGVVWDPFKKGKTSIRAGYGIFWDQFQSIGYNRFSTAQPFDISRNIFSPGNPNNNYAASLSGDLIYRNAGVSNPYPFSIPRTPAQRAAFRWEPPALENVLNPDFNLGYVQQFNFNIQQEFKEDYTFSIGYIGNKGTHLWVSRELNYAIPQPLSVATAAEQRASFDERRRLSSIRCTASDGRNRLATAVSSWKTTECGQPTIPCSSRSTADSARGSRCWDPMSRQVPRCLFWGQAGGNGPRNPFDFAADQGLSQNDVDHRFVISYLWQFPRFDKFTGIAGTLLNGWQFNGITTIREVTPSRS